MTMKKANLVLAAALAAAGITSVVTGLLTPATAIAQAAPQKQAAAQKIGAKMLKPLKAAQDAIGAKNWDAAIASLTEAQAIEPKTPYEAFMVDELGWYARLQTKDYKGAEEALARAAASGFVAEADLPQRNKALAQINYQLEDYAKAVEYGNKYLAAAPGSADIGALVAQSKYLQEDYAGARTTVDQVTTGQAKPDEQLLLIGLRSNYELKDRPGTVRSLEALVRHYPATKYWEDLLNNQLYETKTDRDLRALYRLIADTKTMDRPDEYSEAAATLMTGGFPTEAKQLLEQGVSAGAFQGESLVRAQADLARARSGADADRKELPGADQALAAAKTGNEMVAMGKLFFSVGEYGKAADAIQKGLAKGGVSDADDANMLAGIAHTRAGKSTEALAAFDAVKDPKLAEVARLWKLRVETSGATAS
jgi:outer membrane protein assembly factor BamD (BamD/ComL family)